MNDNYSSTRSRKRTKRLDKKHRREIARLTPVAQSRIAIRHLSFVAGQEQIQFNWTGQITEAVEVDGANIIEMEKLVPRKIDLFNFGKFDTRHVTGHSASYYKYFERKTVFLADRSQHNFTVRYQAVATGHDEAFTALPKIYILRTLASLGNMSTTNLLPFVTVLAHGQSDYC